MNGVIVLAPADAEWATRAEHALSEAHLLVARLYEPKLLPLLVQSGGVHAIAIDSRIAAVAIRAARGCIAPTSSIRMLLVHEGSNDGSNQSNPWPADMDGVRQLLGLPQT